MESFTSEFRGTTNQPLIGRDDSLKKQELENIKQVRLSALDDLVSVNSLFTIAIFLGLSFASPNQQSLDNRPECSPGVKMEKRLVVYEVVSFACFLFSSLVAKSLKLYLSVHSTEDDLNILNYHVIKPRRGFMSLLSVLASAVGVVFLTLSMVDVVQIKIGKMSCGIGETQAAVISLCTIVALALIIYLPSTVMTIISITFVSK
ncbi:uncharacterized protein LOC110666163 isoform X1 [Hevea brasiliensis]|uniref:uncharacterized protein LOC110666163 isoform X1 n=1 Tax=Hevea brasiliensis TaxID=3981 RepID=UPI0025D730B5|nr:uncharacterized protein LOC110666163 isoform X1 [Hevea brasiliensis]